MVTKIAMNMKNECSKASHIQNSEENWFINVDNTITQIRIQKVPPEHL